MNVGIIGSTDYYGAEAYKRMVGLLSAFGFDKETNKIITGKNKGTDALAKAFAEDSGQEVIEVALVKKEKEYPNPYFSRNYCSVIDKSDIVVVFWNGDDTIVQNAVNHARVFKKPTVIFYH